MIIDNEIINILKVHKKLKTLDILEQLNSYCQFEFSFYHIYPALNRLKKQNLIISEIKENFAYYRLTKNAGDSY